MLPRIALKGVSVHLAARRVLHDVSWSLQPLQHWAFVGPNGSGKSTLLRVLAGSQWIDHDGGRRTYSPDGVRTDVTARAATWIRHVWSEEHERYARLDLPLSGRDIIESGFDNSVYPGRSLAPAEVQRVDALLTRLELSDFAACAVRELSSGQIRRLLIARALVGEPRVLILDEFTNGLDAAARRGILAFLDRIAASLNLIVASHRTDDFPSFITHTGTLADGRLCATALGRPVRRHGRLGAAAPQSPVDHGAGSILVRIRNADVYRGATLVLKQLSWEIRRGEHSVIRGANGAGKTTFAGLIAGTISAATGAEIVRFGESGPFDIWKLKARVAHVSDDLQIAYDRGETVQDVIASGFPASIGLLRPPLEHERRTVNALIGRIGLEPLRDRIFTRLSFGERRKVLIARSLVRRPAIYILDEVWNGLDLAFRAALRSLLEEIAAAGTTIVVIGHDDADDELSLLRRAYRIEAGQLCEEALHEAIH